MLTVQNLVRAQPIQRYSFQMLQASLRSPSTPQTSYSFLSLLTKQNDWVQTTATTSAELYASANTLSTSASLLDSQKPTSLFRQSKVTSSDAAKVSAQAFGLSEQATHSVEVRSLATAQVNSGLQLTSQEKTHLQDGTNRFALTVNGSERTLSILSLASDTNVQSLERIADAINAERFGVKAKVVTDKQSGKSQLTLSSSLTGSKQAFSLRDLEGNAIRATGINQVKTEANDAVYKVDGKQYQSGDNTVSLGKNRAVELTLRQVTSSPVAISIGTDQDAIVKQTKQLLSKYNQFHDKLEHSTSVFTVDLSQGWDRMTASLQPQLAKIGITRNQDGTFQIQEEKLHAALQQDPGAVERALGSKNGLAAKISAQADRLQQTPLYLLSIPSPFSGQENPYHDYLLPNLFLSQASSTGLFFNQWF